MTGIRAKLSVAFEPDGSILIQMDWVDVRDEKLVKTLATEKVRMNRSGPSYISRTVFAEGSFLPGTFWVDEAGKRHFIMEAEAGVIPLVGHDMG